MENLSEQEQSVIKEAQEAILKNLSTLNDAERANMYSKFQAIKYKKLDFFDAFSKGIPFRSSAFYNPNENAIYCINDEMSNNFNIHTLIHEMIHGITTDFSNSKSITGISKSNILKNEEDTIICINENIAINEGFTEFFTTKFLDKNLTKSYPHFVDIVKYLSEMCGYKNLKQLYFNNDLQGIKELIKTNYHLPDTNLVETLFQQMEYSYNNSVNKLFLQTNKYQFAICYKTLLQMEIIRQKAINPNVVFTKQYVIDFFSKYKNYFISKERDEIVNNLSDNITLINNHLNYTKLENEKINNLTVGIINACLSNNQKLKDFYKKHLDSNFINILYKLNSGWGIMKNDNHFAPAEIIDKYLTLLHNKDEKISLSNFNNEQKYEIILNAMTIKDGYKHFYAKDLINFVNNGLDEYKFFLNRDAMEYIYLNVKNINDDIKSQEDFDRVYQQVKLDCGYALELQQKEKEEQTL